MKRHNGTMTEKDLADYSSEWVEPISTTYRDWTVYEMPPNGQGIGALEMLNIMETFPLGEKDSGFGSTKALHAMIEAKKLAYADVAKYLADPRGQKIPVATLISKAWAAERAKLIDPDKAACDVAAGEIAGGSDTTYLSVVDRDGNMVSLIQSNYSAFGSGIVAAGRVLSCTIAEGCSRSMHLRRTRWRGASARGIRLFRVCAEGRYAHGVWDHGRMESGAGARAVHREYCGFQDEHPGGDGSGRDSRNIRLRAATWRWRTGSTEKYGMN